MFCYLTIKYQNVKVNMSFGLADLPNSCHLFEDMLKGKSIQFNPFNSKGIQFCLPRPCEYTYLTFTSQALSNNVLTNIRPQQVRVCLKNRSIKICPIEY